MLVEFNVGVVKEADLAQELWGEVFEPLKDPQFFQQVALNPETGTIESPNVADFTPEFFREMEWK